MDLSSDEGQLIETMRKGAMGWAGIDGEAEA